MIKPLIGLHLYKTATVRPFKAINGWTMAQMLIEQPTSHQTHSIHSSRRWVTAMVRDSAQIKRYNQCNQQMVPNSMPCWNPSYVTQKQCQLSNSHQCIQCLKQCNHQQQMATTLNKTRQVCSRVAHGERNQLRRVANWAVEVAIRRCSKTKALYSNISRLNQLLHELILIGLWQANCTRKISTQSIRQPATQAACLLIISFATMFQAEI